MAAAMIPMEDSDGCIDDGGDASFSAGVEMICLKTWLRRILISLEKIPIDMYTSQYLYGNGSDITSCFFGSYKNLLIIQETRPYILISDLSILKCNSPMLYMCSCSIRVTVVLSKPELIKW